MKPIFLGLLLLGLFTTCVVVERDQYDEILSGNFILSELNGQAVGGEAYPVKEPPSLTFTEEDMLVSGFSGCNEMSGKLRELGEQEIRFGNFALTRKTCSGNLEIDFVAMLEKANRYEFRNGRLILYHDQEPLAKFFQRSTTSSQNEEL